MIKKLTIPIFHGTLILFQDVEPEKAFAMVNIEYDGDDYFGAISQVCEDRNGNRAFVIIFDECDPQAVAHEAVHVAHRIAEEHGINYDEEFIAYMTGWVVTQCHKYLRVD